MPDIYGISLSSQRGYSTIAMVMLLMLFGTLMLKGLNGQLTTQVKMYADERRYLLAYQQAVSSLSWGLVQIWNDIHTDWQCRYHAQSQLKACVRRLNDTHVLLRGEGSFGQSQPALTFFQLAEIIEDKEPVSEIKFKASPYGMIDYCPLRVAAEC